MSKPYPKGYFKEIQESLKNAAYEQLKKCSNVGEMRRLDRFYKLKRNGIKFLSIEYAHLLKKTKGNISPDNFTISVINDTLDIILKSKDPHEIKRSIILAKEKIRFFK